MRRLIKKSPKLLSASGFTLIELLLVIVIIGILSGIVIAVINPAQTRQRANETILKGNTDKICYALFACAANRLTPLTSCNTDVGIESVLPQLTPATAVYTVGISATNPLVLYAQGVLGGCTYRCEYNTGTGTSTPTSDGATGCLAL